MELAKKICLFSLYLSFFTSISAQDATWKYIDTTNSPLPSNMIKVIKFAKDGTIWIGTWENGLVKIKDDKWTLYNIANSPLPHNQICSIEADFNGSVWIGTYGGGVVNIYEEEWTVYNSSNTAEIEDVVYDIEIDSSRNVWISGNTGLYKFDRKKWMKVESPCFLKMKIPSIAFDKDKLWVGSLYGLVELRPDTCVILDYPELPLSSVYSLKITKTGNLLAAFKTNGISILNGAKWTHYSDKELPSNTKRCYYITEDKKGKIWAATFGSGVLSYDGKKWTSLRKSNSPMHDDLIFSIEADQYNNKWLCSYSAGIIIYNEDGIKNIK